MRGDRHIPSDETDNRETSELCLNVVATCKRSFRPQFLIMQFQPSQGFSGDDQESAKPDRAASGVAMGGSSIAAAQ